MTFYVERIKPNGDRAVTGPMQSRSRAEREAESWRQAGHQATVKEGKISKEILKEMAARRKHNEDVGLAPRHNR